MRVVLIGNKKLYSIDLPQNIEGNYWIIDKNDKDEKRILNIIANDGKWEIISDNFAQVINPKSLNITTEEISVIPEGTYIAEKAVLKENGIYALCLGDLQNVYMLNCLSEDDKNFIHYDINDLSDISVGFNNNNSIVFKNALISGVHFRLFKKNDRWFIKNYDLKYGTFVNNIAIHNETKPLSNGDIIFTMGLKIILMKNSIYINNPQNSISLNEHFLLSKIKNTEFELKKDNEDINNYRENPYYSRAPRMMNLIETAEVKIDAPPQLQDTQEKPMVLLISSSLVMGLISVLSIGSTIAGIKNGTATNIETAFSLITAVLMIIAMLIIPFVNIKYDQKSKEKYEKKRQQRYKDYLNKKYGLLYKIKEKQKDSLYQNYLTAEECAKLILTNNHRLWERKVEDKDFLTVRLGIGQVPLDIKITCPEEQFAMEDDELLDTLHSMVDEAKNIENAPITVSLVKNDILSFIAEDDEYIKNYIKNLIIQLITFHSYDELKLVFLIDESTSDKWEYVKLLPHIWNNVQQIRFFGDNYDDMNEIMRYLGEELKNRKVDKNKKDDKNKNNYHIPHYIIITNNYKQIENFGFITDFLKLKQNLGFSLVCITDDLYQLPNECKTFVKVEDKKAILFSNEKSLESQKKIYLEPLKLIAFDRITQKLANIPIKMKSKGASSLKTNYTFLEMYDVGRIEKLNILERWKRNDSTLSLKTPIGIDGNGRIISLDIHEKFHGPHGLVAGSTGSGKSEFIITYILSLAINYHPDDVTFLLIDYKGGGLAGAFQKNGIKIPHLVGTITNIDKNGLQRSLTSIQSELRRRQVMFNEARNITEEGTIDIYKYQRLYHEGVVNEPISHLLIICDEFAELKQQQPDFMDELMSVSRIGRSLGVHLILATQKPAGIVNDQIRSNSKFAVCLKVQDTSDSIDVIKKQDAAFLKNAGQFYLQVGNDEYFVLGQSAWAGAPYFPSDIIKKNLDTSVEFISNIGMTIKRIDDTTQQIFNSEGEQLTNIVKYICNIAVENNIKTKNLWLDILPADIYVKKLREKYEIKTNQNSIYVIIGEYDDPYNQKQGIVAIDLLKKENIAIYGNAESGKETLLSTMIYDLITTYKSEQVQFYILDFGSEALKIYNPSAHVGDVLFVNDEEKLERLFEMLQKELKDRKNILSDYNGDYDLFISQGNVMPILVVILNNFEVFDENYSTKYEDLLLTLTRDGLKCGIIFVFTLSANSMRYRMKQNFSQNISLRLNNDDDYYGVFDQIGKKRPSNIFGRGLVRIDKDIYEFQTARICDHINYNTHIEETIKEINNYNELKAKSILVMPEILDLSYTNEFLVDISQVPIGMNKDDLSIYTYDFEKNFITLIASKKIDSAIDYASNLLIEIRSLKDVNANVFDPEKIREKNYNNLQEAFEGFVLEIDNDIKSKNNKHNVCMIIGITKLLIEGIIDKTQISDLFSKTEKAGNFSFIIIDNSTRLESYTYDEWYKNYIGNERGIWVGNGICDQNVIAQSFGMFGEENTCGNSFGFLMKDGNSKLLKLIGLKEKGDGNE